MTTCNNTLSHAVSLYVLSIYFTSDYLPTDFTKVFDLVDHTILIEKMICMGIRRSIVPWICDFLHNRQQCVRFNGVLSDYVSLHGGVPQGTKLGPIGFKSSLMRLLKIHLPSVGNMWMT